MALVQDLDEGIVDRLLATPVSRTALVVARVLHAALTVAVQSVIILLVGMAFEARFPGGVGGFLAILLLAALLAAGIAALSTGLALVTRREETLIAVVQFFGMPLVFLSTALMASALMPSWIRAVARANPVNWSVNAARDAMLGGSWSDVWGYCALLAAFAAAACLLATQAFTFYRRAS